MRDGHTTAIGQTQLEWLEWFLVQCMRIEFKSMILAVPKNEKTPAARN
jgi:hypothetical protein